MRGRPDYWYGMIGGRSTFAPGQSQFDALGEVAINSFSTDTLIDYTVPVDTILVITTGFISSEKAGRTRCKILIDSVPVTDISFDLYAVLPMNAQGLFELTEGEQIEVDMYNYHHAVSQYFWAGLFGYEEIKTQ